MVDRLRDKAKAPWAVMTSLKEGVFPIGDSDDGPLAVAAEKRSYDERHGIAAKPYLTIQTMAHTDWIMARIRDDIASRIVIEIGAGSGILSIAMAAAAKHVYAIECDPAWTSKFAGRAYKEKPINLTWILDRAQNLVDIIDADVAIVSTGSDEDHLRELAGLFAPTVIMPWQDWNNNKALIQGAGVRQCQCVHPGCALLKGGELSLLPPGAACRIACHETTIS